MNSTGTRRYPVHTVRASLALVLLLLLLPLAMPVAAEPSSGVWHVPGPGTKLYIGQSARLIARIPASWTVTPANHFDYSGPDGFVVTGALAGTSLQQVCGQTSENAEYGFEGHALTYMLWRGLPVCSFTSIANPASGFVAANVIVVVSPHPFTIAGIENPFVMIAADPAHFPAILASVSFDLSSVTPREYIDSVLDIVQGRALYRDKIDWTQQRTFARTSVTNWDQAHDFIQALIMNLRLWGDNHSEFMSPQLTNFLMVQQPGFGLLAVGNTVVQVNPDGPAAHAGILAGDRIVTVDGDQVFGPALPMDLSLRFPDTTILTLAMLRPATGNHFTVTLHKDVYEPYLPPTGGRLDHNIGYIELFTTLGEPSDADYVTAALFIVANIDQQPTCGWIVDLRSNWGGGYGPMVQGVAPIVGDGRFFGLVVPGGPKAWISLHNGAIYANGRQLISPVPNAPATALKVPQPPVAVLVGPSTASAAEVSAMAFVGRGQSRLFGSPTAGATSANDGYPLIDGYELILATAWEMDRTGHVYTGSIAPDETVYSKTSDFGTPNDAVINAATGWLAQQPACQQMNATATPAA